LARAALACGNRTENRLYLGRSYDAQSAALSLQVKCRIERLKQSRVTEGLEQALHGALFE